MLALLRLLVPFVLFPLAAAVVLRLSPAAARLKLFAAVNVFGALGMCLVSAMTGLYFWQLKAYLQVALPVFIIYFLAVVLHYILLRAYSRKPGWTPSIAFLFPIAVMLVVKYFPSISAPFRAPLDFIGKKHVAEFFVGVSYMAFRLSHMVSEVRNGVVEMPTLSEHLSFAFFVPTLSVGPISRYSVFRGSLYKPSRIFTPIGGSLVRILVGLTKYLFLASLIEQLSYKGLLLDSHPHPWFDLPVAAVSYCVYLYLNFSGYCDMAIGTAGLIGIQVDENFDRPFSSRNIQEFWTRWHITLTTYMRDMVFSPLCRILGRRLGPAATPHVIAISIFAVFVAMGAWHGLAWNTLIYGTLHGVGVVSCHYYTIWLKKRLGKKGFTAYQNNPWIRTAGTALTFTFVVFTLFVFANNVSGIREIFSLLR
jgi:D-alanyl-lipoteichoic acid acyltransferase DltB (MBOAT superfamily)